MSRSSAAAIVACARARPSHIRSTSAVRPFAITAPMVFGVLVAIYINRKDGAGARLTPSSKNLLNAGELSCLDDDLGFDLDFDGVAGHWDRTREPIPIESEVHAVDLTPDADAHALLSPRPRGGRPAF